MLPAGELGPDHCEPFRPVVGMDAVTKQCHFRQCGQSGAAPQPSPFFAGVDAAVRTLHADGKLHYAAVMEKARKEGAARSAQQAEAGQPLGAEEEQEWSGAWG